MKALVKYAKGPGNLEIREVEEPKVSGDLVKIRVVSQESVVRIFTHGQVSMPAINRRLHWVTSFQVL